jgi:hypothetical protein
MESADGRTKQRHRRWRIFSLFWLSKRLRKGQSRVFVAVGIGVVLGEVDLMVEEGGLRGCRGHYGHLVIVSIRMLSLRRRRQTHSLIVEEQYLHLCGRGACRCAVSGRHHLGDVAGDGLYNVHVGAKFDDTGSEGCFTRIARHSEAVPCWRR